jgi:hypothetical protein
VVAPGVAHAIARDHPQDLIPQCTHPGLAAARTRGRFSEQPNELADNKQVAAAHALYDGEETDIDTINATLGISRTTLYR